MGLTSILRGFSAILIALAIGMLVPMGVGFAAGEDMAGGFFFGAVVSLITGCGAYAASIGKRPATDFRGALLIILLWWAVAPIFAAIPLTTETMSFGDAYFEAVSAMTTTGAWLSHDNAIATASGMIWRAELQWFGGLASIAIAAAIFIRPAFIGIDTLLPPFARGDKDSFLRPLRNAVGAFLPVYALITFIMFVAIALAGAPVIEAAVLAMSLASTGGFVPHADGLAGYSPAVTAVIFPCLVLGGANFVVVARIFRGGSTRARDIENGAYMLILVWVGLLFWLVAGAGEVALIAPQLFNAASILSTNGFTLGEAPTLSAALVTGIIGGAAVSTAGGFKILRWLVIMRRAREEVRQLVLPSAVFGRGNISNEFGVWMHFLVFTLTLAALLVSFAFGGHRFDVAATAATAALSNAGPLLAIADGGAADYAIFDGPLRAVLIVGMILGRLEAAVALALINFAFWRS